MYNFQFFYFVVNIFGFEGNILTSIRGSALKSEEVFLRGQYLQNYHSHQLRCTVFCVYC